jgi:hypothetical protein
MKASVRWMAAGLMAAIFLSPVTAKEQKGKPAAGDPEAPSCHGTTVNFVDTPSEAAKQAKKEEKLVFVLHVSGQFEDPGIT